MFNAHEEYEIVSPLYDYYVFKMDLQSQALVDPIPQNERGRITSLQTPYKEYLDKKNTNTYMVTKEELLIRGEFITLLYFQFGWIKRKDGKPFKYMSLK